MTNVQLMHKNIDRMQLLIKAAENPDFPIEMRRAAAEELVSIGVTTKAMLARCKADLAFASQEAEVSQ